MDEQKRYEKFNEYLNSIPLDELQKKNEEELGKTQRDFEEFCAALAQGNCSFCGYSLTHFSERKPCFHWLLYQARGFKPRKHFRLLYEQKSYHQINPYLRWAANAESPVRNINDLAEDRPRGKVIEETIKYKNIEWSFSCSEGCLRGGRHKNSRGEPVPHYHFQMKLNGNVIISYGQFHIPFSDYDHFCFAVARGEFDRLRGGHIEGVGMQGLYEHMTPEELLNAMIAADDEDTAQFRTQTLVTADEGTTISRSDLADLFEEHKRTKVPMAKLMQRLKNVSAQTYITPGPGVPEIAARKPNRRGKKKDKGASQ